MFALDWRTYVREVPRSIARSHRGLGDRSPFFDGCRQAAGLHGQAVRHTLVDRDLALWGRPARRDLPARGAQRALGRGRPAGTEALSALGRQAGDVDPFAFEKALVAVPREEDDD